MYDKGVENEERPLYKKEYVKFIQVSKMEEKSPKKTRNKESLNAKGVVNDIKKQVGKGRLIVMKDILKKNGYSDTMAKNPKKVRKTKTYQKEIAPLVERMVIQRDLAIARMQKTIGKAKYRDAVDGLDKLTKNIQLLTGGATSRPNIADLLDSIEKGND